MSLMLAAVLFGAYSLLFILFSLFSKFFLIDLLSAGPRTASQVCWRAGARHQLLLHGGREHA